MKPIAQIEQRREEILQEIAGIRSMLRATLKEQMLPVPQKGKAEPVLRGPYFVLAKWQPERKKTRSRRVKRDELAQVKQDVENHKRFLALTEEYSALTERLGELEREQGVQDDAVKKKPLRRSRQAKK